MTQAKFGIKLLPANLPLNLRQQYNHLSSRRRNLITIIALNLIHIISTITQNVDANPTITFITKDQIINIGDDLSLQCTFVDSGGYSIGWTRIDTNSVPTRISTIARGTNVDVPSNRFHAIFDKSRQEYTLKVDQVNENDAGIYQCQIAQGTSMPQTARTNVFVRIPPTISDNSTRSVITSVGSDLQMQCYANGYPQPTISWRRNKNSLLPLNGGVAIHRGNTLNLKNITKADRGTYYCVADNGVSPGARRGISVEIEFKPVVKVGQVRYEQALQYDADLRCSVEAFPSPSITWIKDGVELSNNQHYSLDIFDSSNEFSQTTLRVKKIEKRQYGTYLCRAANKFGYSEAEVRLDETPNVVCPPACDSPNYVTSNAISLYQQLPYDHLTLATTSLTTIMATAISSLQIRLISLRN